MSSNEDHYNPLFPEDSEKPESGEPADDAEVYEDSELTPEQIKQIESEIENEYVMQNADRFEFAYRNIAAKWAFEVLLNLINPPPSDRKKIVSGIMKMADRKIVECINQGIEDIESREDKKSVVDSANKSLEIAQARFLDDYADDIMDEEFLETCRLAVRKNLSR